MRREGEEDVNVSDVTIADGSPLFEGVRSDRYVRAWRNDKGYFFVRVWKGSIPAGKHATELLTHEGPRSLRDKKKSVDDAINEAVQHLVQKETANNLAWLAGDSVSREQQADVIIREQEAQNERFWRFKQAYEILDKAITDALDCFDTVPPVEAIRPISILESARVEAVKILSGTVTETDGGKDADSYKLLPPRGNA